MSLSLVARVQDGIRKNRYHRNDIKDEKKLLICKMQSFSCGILNIQHLHYWKTSGGHCWTGSGPVEDDAVPKPIDLVVLCSLNEWAEGRIRELRSGRRKMD